MLSPATQYRCANLNRLRLATLAGLNGIDYLEVAVLPDRGPGFPDLRQHVLFVHLIKAVPTGITALDVLIEGGVRVANIAITWAIRADDFAAAPASLISADDKAVLTPVLGALGTAVKDNLFIVRTDVAGDFSPYDLTIFDHTKTEIDDADDVFNTPRTGFDEKLSRVTFSFKVDCATDFDCLVDDSCPPVALQAPIIDYLSKDYASFRTLMLNRMAQTIPAWEERNPADIGVMLVEILAYAADQLSYFQDAVANEAYLGTARRRSSMRRHARLLDYTPREGTNSRTFVRFDATGLTASTVVPIRTTILTKTTALGPGVTLFTTASDLETFVSNSVVAGSLAFQTLDQLTAQPALSTMQLHTWGDDDCCLPKGATRATITDPDLKLFPNGANGGGLLVKGMLLAFIEVSGPHDNDPPNPNHRHVVRLTKVGPVRNDPLFKATNPANPLQVVDIEWGLDDALPFPLCLRVVNSFGTVEAASVVEGNIVLADHGQSVSELLPSPLSAGTTTFRPQLRQGPVTFQGQVTDASGNRRLFDSSASATANLVVDPHLATPAIILQAPGTCDPTVDPVNPWTPVRDLLESSPFDQSFVVETENDGSAELRFGDDQLGAKPVAVLQACYRVGLGTAGNIGAGGLVNIVTTHSELKGLAVTNPLPATGGTEPEPLEETRLSAPQAFRTQERAVTSADYADIAQRHPEVQRAVATRRFTGSWYTMFVAVDRLGGLPVDAAFKQEFAAFLERFRLAGVDLEIQGAVPVPLDVLLTVCVKPGFFRFNVKQAILDALSSHDLSDGTRGFFHPDNLTFGQPVFLSQIIAVVLAVPGVGTVETGPGQLRFQRVRQVADANSDDGVLRMGPLEIAELDNDPNRPENGTLELVVQGGS